MVYNSNKPSMMWRRSVFFLPPLPLTPPLLEKFRKQRQSPGGTVLLAGKVHGLLGESLRASALSERQSPRR